MLTLIIDTSHKYLAVGLAKNSNLIFEKQEPLKKQQSEYLIPFINDVFEHTEYSKKDLDAIVLTDGPGSYTGMRIAITFVKTFYLTNPNIKVFTLNTLLSLTGKNDGFSFIDARSNRTFGTYIKNGEVFNEAIYLIEEIKEINEPLYGDTHLFDLEEPKISIAQNILDLKDQWNSVKSVDTLVPRYLK